MGIPEAPSEGTVLLSSTYAKPLQKRAARVVATLFLATAFALAGAPAATAATAATGQICDDRPGPCFDRPGWGRSAVDSSDPASSSGQIIHPVCGGQKPGICPPYPQAQ